MVFKNVYTVYSSSVVYYPKIIYLFYLKKKILKMGGGYLSHLFKCISIYCLFMPSILQAPFKEKGLQKNENFEHNMVLVLLVLLFSLISNYYFKSTGQPERHPK